jgi:hypothetical protein
MAKRQERVSCVTVSGRLPARVMSSPRGHPAVHPESPGKSRRAADTQGTAQGTLRGGGTQRSFRVLWERTHNGRAYVSRTLKKCRIGRKSTG